MRVGERTHAQPVHIMICVECVISHFVSVCELKKIQYHLFFKNLQTIEWYMSFRFFGSLHLGHDF